MNNIKVHLIAPKDKNKWPKIWRHCYQFWENCSYDVKLWNDEEDIDYLIKEDNPEFFEVIRQLPVMYKVDYVRYIILEKIGGACFDMDVEIFHDFLPMLDPSKIYIAESSNPKELVQNSIMINLKPNSFWGHVKKYSQYKVTSNFEKCQNFHSETPPGVIVRKTVGPLLLSKFIKSTRFENNINLLANIHFNRSHDVRFSYHHHTGNWVY